MSRKETDRSRIYMIRLMTGGLLVFAVLSQARVHLISRGSILDRARESKRFIVETNEVARRGAIYSADGKALSQADDRRILVVDFRKVPHSSGFFMELGAITGIPSSELSDQAAAGAKVLEWDRTFTSTQAEAIQNLKRKWRADGVGMKVSSNRAYGLGEAASSLVGVYRANGPQLGVEQAMDGQLKGIDGRIVGMVDKEGQYLPMRVDRSTRRKTDGKPITLTIDSELQHVAYESIKTAVEARRARQGAVVMMDPTTGNILACASYPSFDPSKPFRTSKPGEVPQGFATAFQASLEPGSTFKIATVAKALDEGVLGPHDIVNCPGSITVGKRTLHCAQHGGSRAHGAVDPEMAIARSCNVAAAQWALRIGTDKFNEFIQDLGLLERRPLGLPGEPRPQYDLDAPAPRLHLANVGFGQSINVTPVALATAFCSIANGGTSVKPRLVERVGDDVQPIEKGKRILKPETCETVLNFMRSVITSDRGTGKGLRIPGYDLGGKTGTAQKTNRSTKSMKGGGYVANFVGFVPVSNPRAVILVMVDDPQGAQYFGGEVAGPVFLEVAKSAIKRLGIPKGVVANDFERKARAEGILPRKLDPNTIVIDEEPAKKPEVKAPAPEVREDEKPIEQAKVKLPSPGLKVAARPLVDRLDSRVIGRNDRPITPRAPKSEIILPGTREVVAMLGEPVRQENRLKLRKEEDEPAKSSKKSAAKKEDEPKAKVSSAKPSETKPTAKSTKKSTTVKKAEEEPSRPVRRSSDSKEAAREPVARKSEKSSVKETATKPREKRSTVTKKEEPTRVAQRTTTTGKKDTPKKAAITLRSKADSDEKKPTAKTETRRSSVASRTKSEPTAKKTTVAARTKSEPESKKATVKKSEPTKTAERTTVKTRTASDRLRELEQENARLRKLLGSKSSKGAAPRNPSSSKKSSSKPASGRNA